MDGKVCGAPLGQSARGRTPEDCSDRCRKAGQRAREAATPLRLEFEAGSDIAKLDAQALDPESLTYYSRKTLCYQGAHDQALRAWLRTFAQRQGYPSFWFTVHGSRSGYYQAGVSRGEEGWTRFIERAVQYDIYCAFIAAYAPGQLQRYLEDCLHLLGQLGI
jgi:hypothetical protein